MRFYIGAKEGPNKGSSFSTKLAREKYNLLYGGDMNDPIHNFTLRYHCIGGGHGVNRLDWRNGVYAHRRGFNRVYRDFLRTVQKEKEVLTRPLSFRLLRSN